MTVIIVTIELYISQAQSLKDKRQVVKSLVGRIKAKVNASAAEVDFQELWQRSAVGVAMVGTDRTVLESQVNLLRRLADDSEGAEVVNFTVEYV